MKLTLTRQLTVFFAATLTSFSAYYPAQGVSFEQQEVEQSQFIAIARPFGENKYDLLILQQLPGQRQCWSENSSNPILVTPLLLNFDFTGSCERSTDSNGYSLRLDGQDYGLDYLLRLVERNGELVLVGTHRTDPSQKEIIVGRTEGISKGFLKITLNPGWRFTKRAYQGRVLSHVYLTGDSAAIQSPELTPATAPASPTLPQRFTPSHAIANTALASPLPANADSEIREITFTANDANNNSSSPSLLPPPTPPTLSSPAPISPTTSFSDLPPLPPPSPVSNASLVPPPPVSTSSNTGRKSLSDVLVVAPRSNVPNGERLSVPDAPLPKNNDSSWNQTAYVQGYRVMVTARGSSQQSQVRSLYPDAFPTSYKGRSLWQIGVFSNQDNAQQALQSLENLGLEGVMISQ